MLSSLQDKKNETMQLHAKSNTYNNLTKRRTGLMLNMESITRMHGEFNSVLVFTI